MVTRREWLGITLGAGATFALNPHVLRLLQQGQLIQRAIPSTGEMVPVIGLGSSATFSQFARREEIDALTAVIRTLVDRGAKVFDTAPSYGASEQVAGDIANTLGVANKIFWATKVNVAGRGGGSADPQAALAQIEESFQKFRVAKIDLIQVHNLADVPTHLGVLKDLKRQGRVRYIGVTTTSNRQYEELDHVMRNEPLDFIGIDYAIDNREIEDSILPLAIERKIGVLAYLPFGRNRLFQRVGDQPVPEWAKEFDAQTWAQFFLKYIVSHPAITAATPATSNAEHMADDIGGGIGRLPDAATRKRMAELVDALPPAPARRGPGG
jgi:aryl-alcohol dehydrogenase-like predicted oxidoreductase